MRRLVMVALMAAGCSWTPHNRAARFADPSDGSLPPLSPQQRLDYLADAQVWLGGDPASRDLLAGPPGLQSFAPGAQVTCDFVEPRPDRISATGRTPKFFCTVAPGDDARVRYDNRELHAEVLATRLVWALGFPANAAYPVKVLCRGCPADPWAAYRSFPRIDKSPRQDKLIDEANITRRFPGVTLELSPDQGVDTRELDLIRSSPRAHIDALRLLSAFIQHGDDKAANQRLLCPPEAIKNQRCERPLVMIQDLGSTFGGGASRVGLISRHARADLDDWDREPIWKDPSTCRANLHARVLSHPIISEEGRRFLSDLLAQLSDRQLSDLFTAGRVTRLGNTSAQWVAAFKRKRDQISQLTCGR